MMRELCARRPASQRGVLRARRCTATRLSRLPVVFAILPAVLLLFGVGFSATAAADADASRSPKIRRIVFEGAQHILPEDLRGVMRLRQQSWWQPFQKNYFHGIDHLERDLERIVAHYRAEGFFFMRLEDVLVRYLSRDWVDLEIRVSEGPRIHVRDWTVSNPGGCLQERLEQVIRARPGEPLKQRGLKQDEERLEEICAEAGYALAEVTRELRFCADSVAVIFRVDLGPLVRVGRIDVTGLRRTREVVVRRELALKYGDTFRRSPMLDFQDRLFGLGLFSTIRILPAFCDTCVAATEPDEVQVDLTVAVREKKPGWYGGGFGFSSSDEIRAFGEWGYRNLGGRAHSLQASASANWSLAEWETRRIENPTEWQVEAVFAQPWLFGTPIRGQIRTYYRFNREPTFEEDIASVAFHARRDLGRHRALLGSIQKKWVWSTDPTAGGQDYEIPSLSLTILEDRRDFVLDPRKGYVAQLRGDLAGSFLGGPVSFMRWAASVSGCVPVGGGVRWAYRVRAGYLHPWGKGISGAGPDSLMLKVPLDERFRAGGGTTVRGFVEKSLGPYADGDQPLGGLVLVLLNAELRFPLVGHFEGVLFLDAGNAWAHYEYLNRSRWMDGLSSATYSELDVAYSAGVGLRFRTPVGPLRLDLGWKLNRARRAGSSGSELHFTLGQAF